MGGKKKRVQKVQPKKLKGGPKRRVTAAERAKQAELGVSRTKSSSRAGALQRRERARRRQKQKARSKGCWDKFKRRFLSGPLEISMNRRSQVVVGDAMRTLSCTTLFYLAMAAVLHLSHAMRCVAVLPKELRKLKVVFDLIDLECVKS